MPVNIRPLQQICVYTVCFKTSDDKSQVTALAFELTKALSGFFDMIRFNFPHLVMRLHPCVQLHEIGKAMFEVDGGIFILCGRSFFLIPVDRFFSYFKFEK